MHSFAVNIFSGDVMPKDILKSFRNLIRNGNGKICKEIS